MPPVTVRDVYDALDRFAPFAHAAEWDNVGLLAGRPTARVRRVLIALDLTDAVAAEALRTRSDLLVVYHPPIFKGIRSITARAEAPTSRLPELLGAGTAIIALHTALDAAAGGTNDVLLDAVQPAERFPLEPLVQERAGYKVVVFVPAARAGALRAALAAAGAGVIGRYTECSFELDGHGTFRGDETTNPTVGSRGRLERVPETRLELVVPAERLGPVVRALYATHPYEEPAFDLYPLHAVAGRAAVGLGRVGLLRRPEAGTTLLRRLGRVADLSNAAVVGELRRKFRGVLAAAGAFGVRAFRDPDVLVVTGEFKHHDALELLKRGVTAVQLGHFASEAPVRARIRAVVVRAVRPVRVAIARADRPPLRAVRG